MVKSDASNVLLDRLSVAQRKSFIGSCELFELELGLELCEVQEPIQYVYFPLSGFISVAVSVADRPLLNVSFVGYEGMLGVDLALGVKNASAGGIVRGVGSAYRMKAAKFSRLLKQNLGLRRIVNEYFANLLFKLALNSGCIHFHEVAPRLARCLLEIHDRIGSDHFTITHQSLAGMLGVQRRAVTGAAVLLKVQGVISYARGNIVVLDRSGLENASCECFQMLSEYDEYAYC